MFLNMYLRGKKSQPAAAKRGAALLFFFQEYWLQDKYAENVKTYEDIDGIF